MTRRLHVLLVMLIFSAALVGLHRFGRSLWFPLVVKVYGGETVASVITRTTSQGLGLSESEHEWVRDLTIIALKEERSVEVWGRNRSERRELLRTYRFSGYSGELGPKLRESDGQIPEGVYQVEYLNPNSSYHLSIKLDYPNAFDREKGRIDGRDRLGFDIFLHGKSVTVGCIPIGDAAIEELFTIAAQVGIKRIAVIIAPWDFRVRDDEPEIEGIDWEAELYESARRALNHFSVSTVPGV